MSTERDPPRLSRGGEGVPAELSRALGAARGRVPAESVLAAVAARLPGGPAGGGPGGGGAGAEGGGAGGLTASGTAAGGLGGATLPLAAATSVWPGIFLGAALGALVGGASLLVPVGPSASSAPLAASGSSSASSVAPHGGAAGAPIPGSSVAVASGPAALGEPSGSTSGPGSTSTSTSITALPPTGTPSSSAADGSQGTAGDPVAAEAESDYLRRAHAQLSSSPAQALALAEAHPLRYPAGKLSQERELIVVSALAALGRTAEAQARARVFFARYPGSAHRRRLQVLLPGLGEPEKNPQP